MRQDRNWSDETSCWSTEIPVTGCLVTVADSANHMVGAIHPEETANWATTHSLTFPGTFVDQAASALDRIREQVTALR